MKRTAELILGAFLIAAIAYAVGSCGRDAVKQDRDTAYKLANHYRWQRDSTLAAQAKTDTVTRIVIRADARLSAQNDSLMSVLTYADSVLRDSAATLASTRIAVAVTMSRAAEFQSAALIYRDSVRVLIAAHAEERFATNKTLALADSSIAAWKQVADSERRNGWRKFTQGAFVGGIVALLAVVTL